MDHGCPQRQLPGVWQLAGMSCTSGLIHHVTLMSTCGDRVKMQFAAGNMHNHLNAGKVI